MLDDIIYKGVYWIFGGDKKSLIGKHMCFILKLSKKKMNVKRGDHIQLPNGRMFRLALS